MFWPGVVKVYSIIPKYYPSSTYIIFLQGQLRSKYETVGLIYDNVKYMSR